LKSKSETTLRHAWFSGLKKPVADLSKMSAGVVSNMPPPARRSGQKRQREQTLLEEDEWTDRIEAIIQRDFFPDLPKLQNKLEWLQVGAEP